MVKMSIDLKCDQEAMDRCLKRFKHYCTNTKIDEIQEILDTKAKKSVTDKLVEDFEYTDRYVNKLLKEVEDLKSFQFETEVDMKEKPNQDFVTSSLTKLKENIVQTAKDIKKAEKELSRQIKLSDRLISQLKGEVSYCKVELT